MNTDLLMGKARESIDKISPNTSFVVKDLFKGVEWNDLSRGDKLGFGKAFKNAVNNGQFDGVRYIGKRDNNSAEYMRVTK